MSETSLGKLLTKLADPDEQGRLFRASLIFTARNMKRDGMAAEVIVSAMLDAAVSLAHGCHVDLPQIEAAIRDQWRELDEARAAKA